MPDGIEITTDIRPILDLLDQPISEFARQDKFRQLRAFHANCKTSTEQYAEQLRQLYDDIVRSGHDAAWLEVAAEVASKRELTAREQLLPGIEALKQTLRTMRRDDSDARLLISEIVAVGEAWVALPATLHDDLLRLAAERRAAANKIRHASPVQGEIDHAELTREIIVRFPNIMAELAK